STLQDSSVMRVTALPTTSLPYTVRWSSSATTKTLTSLSGSMVVSFCIRSDTFIPVFLYVKKEGACYSPSFEVLEYPVHVGPGNKDSPHGFAVRRMVNP